MPKVGCDLCLPLAQRIHRNLATDLRRFCRCSAHDVESTKPMFEGSSKRLMFRQFLLLQGRKSVICSGRAETQGSGARLGAAVRNTASRGVAIGVGRARHKLFANRERVKTPRSLCEQQGEFWANGIDSTRHCLQPFNKDVSTGPSARLRSDVCDQEVVRIGISLIDGLAEHNSSLSSVD